MNTPRSARVRRRFDEGFALHRQGRVGEALVAYDAVLATEPRHPQALHLSALALHATGRSADALQRIERSLAIDATEPDVWSNAALIYGALGRHDAAAAALERALRLEPTLVDAWLNLASLRLETGEAEAAEAAARSALALGPSVDARLLLASALAAGRRHDEALAELDRIAASDASVAAWGQRAAALIALGRPDEARRVLDHALARADDARLSIERARLADARGDDDAAIADYRHVLARDPGDEVALSELLFLQKRRVVRDGLEPLRAAFAKAVQVRAATGTASALTPFSYLSDPSTRAEQRRAAEAWSRRWPGAAAASRPKSQPLSSDRLRIGYLSSDLHDHATAVLTAGLFEQHDRTRFVVHAYSTGPDDGGPLRARLAAGFDRFVDARGWNDARIAAAIRDDGIDVLVDLKGHTANAPTGVTALRPAPIAVSWLGYPGTMGASFVDYLIGDPVVTPLAHAADYSETLVLLPHCYQVTDDRRAIGAAPSRAALGLPADAVVLCCFNALYKIDRAVLAAWAAILAAAPGSVLWLLTRAGDDAVRTRLRREAGEHGVAPERIVFADARAHADYLALYRHADLFVDTWPYGAHTTASDALWAGCPVLTLLGETFAGRVGASLVTAVGLADCIATGVDGYVAQAIDLAADRARLATLRERLQRNRSTLPLFDTRATTRAVEAAYLAMAAQYRAGRRAPIVL